MPFLFAMVILLMLLTLLILVIRATPSWLSLSRRQAQACSSILAILYFFSALSPDAGAVAGVELLSAGGVVADGVAPLGAAAGEPESAGAGVVGAVGAAAGAAGDGSGVVAAGGVAGASSRLLQPASTAVKTAAARMVWRINMFCLLRLFKDLPRTVQLSQAGLFPFHLALPVREHPIFMSAIHGKNFHQAITSTPMA